MKWISYLFANYWRISGRVSRSDYWNIQVRFGIVPFITSFVTMMFLLNGSDLWLGLLPIWAISSILLVVPLTALTVRRLHDTGHSGSWIGVSLGIQVLGRLAFAQLADGFTYFLSFLQLMAGLYIFILTCLSGDPGPNQYGPDPIDAG
jgi:uncharacterized membrane protein YhaH (DUF805 family)